MARRAPVALFGAAILSVLLSPPFGARDSLAAQLRVCTFSFNAPHEIEVFKRRLPARDFEILDLGAELARRAPSDTAASRLLDICRRGLQCDVVVYAAEFAGRFFGERGTSIGIHELEEASCNPACRGLFQHPKEVFLLGCNTLATKDHDNRSPARYREVLREHGFDAASAEHAVELRYGPLGPSFRQSVRRIFAGVPRIYGFDSVAPKAPQSARMLDAYFRGLGSYARYLGSAGRQQDRNRLLHSAYAGTNFAQTSGLQPSEAAASDRQLICSLYDESRPVVERLRTIQRLSDREDFLAFVPTLKVFLARHAPQTLNEKERAVLDAIKQQRDARERLLELVRKSDMSAVRMDLAELAFELRWMPKDEFDRLALAWTKAAIARPVTSDVVDVTCELAALTPVGAQLDVATLPNRLFRDPEGIRLLDCVLPRDHRIDARLATAMDADDTALRVWAAYALSRRAPLKDDVLQKMARHVDDDSEELREGLRGILLAHAPLQRDVQKVVAQRDPGLARELEHVRRARLLADAPGRLMRPGRSTALALKHRQKETPPVAAEEPVYALEGAAFRSTR